MIKMVSIYVPSRCLHFLDYQFREFFNMPLRKEHHLYDCENCNGEQDKPCKFTYQNLIDKLIDQEVMI